jgi:hypothetical protein
MQPFVEYRYMEEVVNFHRVVDIVEGEVKRETREKEKVFCFSLVGLVCLVKS